MRYFRFSSIFYMVSIPLPLQHLELLARQVVEGFLIGLHRSPFHGFSVEFAEHRIFNQGDPVRHIDWRVYGRTEKLFSKKYQEETNLRCCLALDTSSSMLFSGASSRMNKLQFSCLAAACLIQLLKRQHDATSLMLFNEQIDYFSTTRSAPSHYRSLTTELERTLSLAHENKRSDVSGVLHAIAGQMHQRSLIVIFSDFVQERQGVEHLFGALQHLKFRKHDVVLFHVLEGRQELNFEFENRSYEFQNMETGEKVRLQPAHIRDEYVRQMHAFNDAVTLKCHQYGIDRVIVDLSKPVEEVLMAFLKKRGQIL